MTLKIITPISVCIGPRSEFCATQNGTVRYNNNRIPQIIVLLISLLTLLLNINDHITTTQLRDKTNPIEIDSRYRTNRMEFNSVLPKIKTILALDQNIGFKSITRPCE